jgi:hypothetical protein
MRIRFTSVKRIKQWAKTHLQTAQGALRAWYVERHPHSLSFDDRALGEVLEEFYFDVASRVQMLRERFDTLSAAEQQRLTALEELLEENEPTELDSEDDPWLKAHHTGDRLVDKWEKQIARGEMPDLDEAL